MDQERHNLKLSKMKEEKLPESNSEKIRRNIANSKTLISKFQFTWTNTLKDPNYKNKRKKKQKRELPICLAHK